MGAVKKLHSNVSIGAIQSLLECQEGKLAELCTELKGGEKALVDWYASFGNFEEVDKSSDVIAEDDVIMNFYLRRCQQYYVSKNEGDSDSKHFENYLLLYMQHVYTRLLLVRSRTLQEKFHSNITTAFTFLTCEFSYYAMLSGTGLALLKLEVPSNFQAKLISALLKNSPEAYLLPSAKRLLSDWTTCFVSASTYPTLDLSKEMFKFIASMKTLGESEKDTFRQMMADIVIVYMKHKLNAPLKILQVVQHQKLYRLLDLTRFESYLVEAVLALNADASIPDILASLAEHVKNSDANKGKGKSRQEVCIRLARLLISASRDDVAAALLCRFQVLNCEEFRPLLYPSENTFNGIADSSQGTSFNDNGIDFDTDITVIDELPVLSLTNAGSPSVVLVNDLVSLRVAEDVLTSLLHDAEVQSCHSMDEDVSRRRTTGVNVDGCMIDPHHVLALDCEWQPQGNNSNILNKCSLLQVSSSSHVFLFDLMVLESAWGGESLGQESAELWSRYSQLMSAVFSCKEVLKLGYHLSGDSLRLRESFPTSTHYSTLQGVHEMSVLQCSEGGTGLAALCKEVLGLAMDKRMQCSDWQRRPLHDKQVSYAALDAVVLIRIWLKTHGLI